MKKIFENKRILVTGGTGSLGKKVVARILSGAEGIPQKVIVFSRDEAKQQEMRLEYMNKKNQTDDIIYSNFKRILEFWIGDVRDINSVSSAISNVDIIINAAALKQVPTCEYFPEEAFRTNIIGATNIVRAVQSGKSTVETVVGISTDKACKPVNVMGITKALQERIFISANLDNPNTRFICVRYGNVIASRGSVIPLFIDQIKNGDAVTITDERMTRFLLPLEKAVDTIIFAIKNAQRGCITVPMIPSALMLNVVKALIGKGKNPIKITGVRPGEKIHELMISEEELNRTEKKDEYYIIHPILPELQATPANFKPLTKEYCSADDIMSLETTRKYLNKYYEGAIKDTPELLI